MSAEVCFAARIPASRAVCSGSPFFTAPRRISRSASCDIVIDPRATASRAVTGLSATSTILTRPRAYTCDSPFLCAIHLSLGEKEGEAFEGDGQVHALQLHFRRRLESARREVQDGPDARRHHQIEDVLSGCRGHRDDGNAGAVTPHDLA